MTTQTHTPKLSRSQILTLLHRAVCLPPPKDHFLRKSTEKRLRHLGVGIPKTHQHHYHKKPELEGFLNQLRVLHPTLVNSPIPVGFGSSQPPQTSDPSLSDLPKPTDHSIDYSNDDLFRDLFRLANLALEDHPRDQITEAIWTLLERLD